MTQPIPTEIPAGLAGLAARDQAFYPVAVEEDDFLAGAIACSREDPECEACQ